MRVGVPRALSFFRFHPAWTGFCEELGLEVIVSRPSTRATLEAGLRYAVPETCLPLKLFYGHVRDLVGRVDMLMVPSILRLAPGCTNCARLIGLPDLLLAAMPDAPPLVAPTVDLSQGARAIWALVLDAGARFTRNPLALRDAAQAGWASYLRARATMLRGRLTPAGFDGVSDWLPPAGQPTLAIVGHPYNLYDTFVNQNLLGRLERLGVGLILPEQLGPWPAPDYWTFEYELTGATRLAMERGDVAGVVAVMAFGCGPDAVLLDEVRGLAADAGVPLLALTLDEHSGEAGLLTRLEAFVDMLNWRTQRRARDLPGN